LNETSHLPHRVFEQHDKKDDLRADMIAQRFSLMDSNTFYQALIFLSIA